MSNDIFHIDWILIDTIIIILLIFLLVGVKIFKSTHRWRSSFSNTSLNSVVFSNLQKFDRNKFILVRKITLISNSSLFEKSNKNPLVLILKTNYKRKLLRILTEGIGSNGFNVISLKIKIKTSSKNYNFKNNVDNELKSIISVVLNWYKEKEKILNYNYILVSHLRSSFSYEAIFNNNKNKGMVLINPKINLENLNHHWIVNDNTFVDNHLYLIFSKKSIFILPNKNLKFIKTNISSQKLPELNIITLEKAKNSFKYYETIVLGIIIDIIKNKSVKVNN